VGLNHRVQRRAQMAFWKCMNYLKFWKYSNPDQLFHIRLKKRQRPVLSLTEHYAIKVYCGSGGIASCILWPWY
jgi:hypothetical protein